MAQNHSSRQFKYIPIFVFDKVDLRSQLFQRDRIEGGCLLASENIGERMAWVAQGMHSDGYIVTI